MKDGNEKMKKILKKDMKNMNIGHDIKIEKNKLKKAEEEEI